MPETALLQQSEKYEYPLEDINRDGKPYFSRLYLPDQSILDQFGEDFLQMCEKEESLRGRSILKIRQLLLDSNGPICVYVAGHHLGDRLLGLPYKLHLARRLAGREVLIGNDRHEELTLPYLDLPPNAQIATKPEDRLKDNEYHQIDMIASGLHTIDVLPVVQARRYREPDLRMAIQMAVLGFPMSEADLRRPGFRIPEEILEQFPQDTDLLIVPDAMTYPYLNGRFYQSMKSLTAQQWKEVFVALPAGIRIGMIHGVSHPEYCNAVFHAAWQTGKKVEHRQTPRLIDFFHEVLRARVFFGMDTGTTHMASMISRDLAVEGRREIAIRSLFNARLVKLYQFGLVGHPDPDTTLVFPHAPGEAGYPMERLMDDANPGQIASWLTRAVQKQQGL
ncbi:MAG: hypothetical protein N2691_02440 [Patescibacteria group bacterium]|nr:hypothetical protein [Patescibacteria group bacterium]